MGGVYPESCQKIDPITNAEKIMPIKTLDLVFNTN